MEEIEERVASLTENLYAVTATDMVKDLVLRAIICALPASNRATALQALETLWLDHQQRLTDVGFERGHSTQAAAGLLETMAKDLERWRNLLSTPGD